MDKRLQATIHNCRICRQMKDAESPVGMCEQHAAEWIEELEGLLGILLDIKRFDRHEVAEQIVNGKWIYAPDINTLTEAALQQGNDGG